jgi:hypothetical protein
MTDKIIIIALKCASASLIVTCAITLSVLLLITARELWRIWKED